MDEVNDFIDVFTNEGIKVSVDALVGMPGESRGSVAMALDELGESRASAVCISQHLRLFETTPVSAKALDRGAGLLGKSEDNSSMLDPVFYCWPDASWLEERLAADERFVLAGKERKVNYQRR
jgi:hypothetical protein